MLPRDTGEPEDPAVARTLLRLREIARILGCPMSDFFGPAPDAEPDDDVAGPPAPKAGADE